MSEAITACENICRDFGWVGQVTEWLGDLGIFLGVLIAWRQLDSWRKEQSMRRKADVAEELIAVSFNVDDALKEMRNPISSVPKEKVGDKSYYYDQRYKLVTKHNELFQSLRDAQIRVRAVIGDSEVDDAVETLFKARMRVALAIELLAEMERDYPQENTQEDREEKVRLRRDLSGTYGERDDLGREILSAVALIEQNLSPVARLEVAR